MAAAAATARVARIYDDVRLQLPVNLSAAGLLRSYESFVSKNSSSVSQIETALRSLTYIVPGQHWF